MSPEIQIYIRLKHTLKPDVFFNLCLVEVLSTKKTSKNTRHVFISNSSPALTRHVVQATYSRWSTCFSSQQLRGRNRWDPWDVFGEKFPITNLPQEISGNMNHSCWYIYFFCPMDPSWDCLIVFFCFGETNDCTLEIRKKWFEGVQKSTSAWGN